MPVLETRTEVVADTELKSGSSLNIFRYRVWRASSSSSTYSWSALLSTITSAVKPGALSRIAIVVEAEKAVGGYRFAREERGRLLEIRTLEQDEIAHCAKRKGNSRRERAR